jgi:hypothetical protein
MRSSSKSSSRQRSSDVVGGINIRTREHPSEKQFGYSFCALTGLLALVAELRSDSRLLPLLAGGLSLVFLLVTVFRSSTLRPLNRAWMALALRISLVTTPVILGVIFFLILTPISTLMRIAGRDELGLSRRRRKTNWYLSSDRDYTVSGYRNQF